jgi:hypothetical protein
MLSVAFFIVTQSVVMLNVDMLSVVVPFLITDSNNSVSNNIALNDCHHLGISTIKLFTSVIYPAVWLG